MRLTDLWRINEDTPRLYLLYLARLSRSGSHERVVAACREIRRHAARGPGRDAGLFTYSFEIDAPCALGQYPSAWRLLRRWEECVFGRKIDLDRRAWSIRELNWFQFHDIPLLYFTGKYRQGCRLLETSLDASLDERKPRSYDVMFRVYNGDEEPENRCRVTLTHYYNRLGKNPLQWPRWGTFVNGFHARLFRLAGVSREEMLVDPGRLPAFFEALMAIRAERTPTGVGGGVRDLTDGVNAVEKRQAAVQEKLERFEERSRPMSDFLNMRLLELFPELRDLEGP